MAIEMKFAESAEEKEAVFRHRYEIYIEEMNRYRGIADHERRVMIEDVDENSRFYYASDAGVVVGSMRWTWGGDADFLQRHIDQYMLTNAGTGHTDT